MRAAKAEGMTAGAVSLRVRPMFNLLMDAGALRPPALSDAERQQLLHFPVSDAGVGPGWVSQGWEGVKAGVPPLSLSAALSLYLRSQNNIHGAVGASGTGPAPRTSPRPGQTRIQITLTGIARIFLSWLFF